MPIVSFQILSIIFNHWIDSLTNYEVESEEFHPNYINNVVSIGAKIRLLSKSVKNSVLPILCWREIELKTEHDLERLKTIFGSGSHSRFRFIVDAAQLKLFDQVVRDAQCFPKSEITSVSGAVLEDFNVLKEIHDEDIVSFKVSGYFERDDLSTRISNRLQNLVKLYIGFDNNEESHSRVQIHHLNSLKSLEDVTLGGVVQIEDLPKFIESTSIRSFGANRVFETDTLESLDSILGSLSKNKSITSFFVNFMSKVILKHSTLVNLLNTNQTLEQFYLSSFELVNDDNDDGAQIHNTTLKKLNLYGRGQSGLSILKRWSGESSLIEQSLTVNTQCLYELFSSGHHPNIRSCYLGGDFDNSSLPVLEKMISSNFKSMKSLALPLNSPVSTTEFLANLCNVLSNSLPLNTHIEDIDIRLPKITECILGLNLPSLRNLYCSVSKEEFLKLFDQLSKNSDQNNIEKLDLCVYLKSDLEFEEIIEPFSHLLENNHKIHSIKANFLPYSKSKNLQQESALIKFQQVLSKHYQHIHQISLNFGDPLPRELNKILTNYSINI